MKRPENGPVCNPQLSAGRASHVTLEGSELPPQHADGPCLSTARMTQANAAERVAENTEKAPLTPPLLALTTDLGNTGLKSGFPNVS